MPILGEPVTKKVKSTAETDEGKLLAKPVATVGSAHTHKDRHRDTQTDRQTDAHTDICTHRHTQTDRHTHTYTCNHYGKLVKQTSEEVSAVSL